MPLPVPARRPVTDRLSRLPRFQRLSRLAVRSGSAIALLAVVSACKETSPPPCTVSGVAVSPSTASLTPGGTTQLNAAVSASNCSPTPSASWSSSAPNIATVSPTGLVTAVTAGSATISATAAGASGTAAITVAPAPIATLTITPAAATAVVGGTVTLTAQARDAAGNVLTGRTITWTSLNANTATVSSAGVVSGVAAGTATITASAEGRTAVAVVTISPPPVASVTVALNAASLTPGQLTQAIATLRDAGGASLDGRTITWQSSNAAAATVDGFGIVTAVAPGTTNITATSEGRSGSAALTVTQIPVASITLAVTNANMRVGEVQAAAAQARDANGSALTDRTITWASSNPAVASVTQGGVITAIAVGATAITASSGGQFATAALIVTPNVASIDLVLGQNPMIVGAQAQATATAKDAGGAVVSGATISFTSSNSSVATVSSASGTVTAVTVGTTNIIATSGAVSRSVALTVNPATVPVASVTISPNGGSVQIGQTLPLTAATLDAGGATLAGRSVTWSSSSPSVASVSSGGLVSGVAAGTSTVTASSEGRSATVSVTVALAPVATVTVSAPSSTVSVGSTMQASAVLTDANGLSLTRPVAWSSSNPNVATVNASGLITAVAAGSVTVSAQSEGKTGNLALTILGTPTLSIASVSPTNGSTNRSIETSFVVTFSENISAATVNATSVALTAFGNPIAASRTVSGKVLTITPTSLLPENSTIALVITTALKSAVGNTLPSAFNGSFGIAQFDPNYYYRFFNNLTGQANSLDTFSNTFQGFMGPTGGFSGQYWYMSPITGAPGYYLMRNLFKGDNWYLEGTDGVSPVELQNTAPNVFSGQAWRFGANGFGPGCFSLQNQNFGGSKSMANVGGSVIMQPTANTGSQCWSIARTGRR